MGVDLYTISKLLGHKDIKMTQRYAHHCTEGLRRGVEAIERISTKLAHSNEKGVTISRNPFESSGGAEGDRTPDLKTASMKQQKTITP